MSEEPSELKPINKKVWINTKFPPDPVVWRTARRIVQLRELRMTDLLTCIIQDPVLVLDIMHEANSMVYGANTELTSVFSALTRLGSVTVRQLLDDIIDNPSYEDDNVRECFELYRSKARRNAIAALLLAEATNCSNRELCQTVAVLMTVGNLLAIANFGRGYTDLIKHGNQAKANYAIINQAKFDPEKAGLEYLLRQNIPNQIVSILDRDEKIDSPEYLLIRHISYAALELVDYYDADKWDKLAPGEAKPSKSYLRLLKITPDNYEKVYRRLTHYFASTIHPVFAKKKTTPIDPADKIEPAALDKKDNLFQESFKHANYSDKIYFAGDENEPEYEDKPVPIEYLPFSEIKEYFSLEERGEILAPRVPPSQKKAPPETFVNTKKGETFITELNETFSKLDSGEDLIKALLEKLTEGPFKKTCLIVVSKDRKYAIVVAARGDNVENGQRLIIEDPLSPLAQCFAKVLSFGNKPNAASPFGSKAFALAPIDAGHKTPVLLYGDCGKDAAITFESRRIFRTAIEILNQNLPVVKGSIPVELQDDQVPTEE